ncbi:cupredoxin domain-containing protein [Pelomonas sp. KK5]|uniref:cupredoxin domain-containing protein n=1 Tax=Pelomonas sp. KK5 TaxID=1855730 RepID=UPI00097BC9E7|nr:cupredoxin domain-containing protein [Pelomonas sp. KK5]
MITQRRSCIALAALTVLGLARAQAAPRTIEITAQRFRFAPRVIALKLGEPVLLKLTALDFPHGFYLPDFERRIDLVPGRAVEFAFTPTRAGTLHFLCDNFCGEGHEGMDGRFEIQ